MVCKKLEGVDTPRICTFSSEENLSSDIAANRLLSENFTVVRYLKKRYGDAPSTAKNRLEATIYVRTGELSFLSVERRIGLQSLCSLDHLRSAKLSISS
jgi:hypothetical protein